MSKPREFDIENDGVDNIHVHELINGTAHKLIEPEYLCIHVIEYSAYEDLLKKNARLQYEYKCLAELEATACDACGN